MDRENIFIVGFPRSGNTWVARLLGDILDSPVKARGNEIAIADEGFGRSGKYIIRQEHSDYEIFSEKDKIILVIRDPRDTIVSAKHYWEFDSIENAANCVIYGKWPTPQGSGWTYFYYNWLQNTEKINVLVKYEDLHKDTEQQIKKILKGLGVSSVKNIKKAVNRQEFSVRKQKAKIQGHKMPHGYNVQNKTLRKGIVGDWKNYFDDDLIEKMCSAMPYDISFSETAKGYGYNVCND